MNYAGHHDLFYSNQQFPEKTAGGGSLDKGLVRHEMSKQNYPVSLVFQILAQEVFWVGFWGSKYLRNQGARGIYPGSIRRSQNPW